MTSKTGGKHRLNVRVWTTIVVGTVAGGAAGLLVPPGAALPLGGAAHATGEGTSRAGACAYGLFWLGAAADAGGGGAGAGEHSGNDVRASGDAAPRVAAGAGSVARAPIISCLCWEPLSAEAAPKRVVVLVHGLDELGGIWDDLGPALQGAGYSVARFEYPNDQPIGESAAFLVGHLRELRARGATRVDLVCHSMGGLVARDALTRAGLYGGKARGHADLPDIERLVTLGTPNHGSPLARYRGVLELRERIARAIETETWRALEPGDPMQRKGGAADDLLPGSEFLNELNRRALPKDVAITVIAARMTDADGIGLGALAENATVVDAVGRDRMTRWIARGQLLTAELGDGVVPLDSTPLAGADDYVVVNANHRSMVKRLSVVEGWKRMTGDGVKSEAPPAIGVILERLAK